MLGRVHSPIIQFSSYRELLISAEPSSGLDQFGLCMKLRFLIRLRNRVVMMLSILGRTILKATCRLAHLEGPLPFGIPAGGIGRTMAVTADELLGLFSA